MDRIYLDRIAATPVRPEVFEAMRPFLTDAFGNPQSLHAWGRRAQEAVEGARAETAALIGAESAEIYFTASGSEANNLAIKGLAAGQQARGRRLVVSAIEHTSVLNSVKALERSGFSAVLVPVDGQGRVDPAAVERELTGDTVLVSVMTANNEIGTIEPVAEIAAVCRARGILFHTDAVAAAGSLPLDVRALGVDALSLAGDQFYGPKGAAALYVRKGVRILPLVDGGIQEGGRRGGTENVAGIVGLGRAAALARTEMAARAAALVPLRDRLLDELPRRVEHVRVTGSRTDRLPHHASFCVEFVEGEGMLLFLDMKGFAASSGSACTSKSLKASHVLLAMGLDHATAQGSLIFSLIDGTEAAAVEALLEAFPPIVERLRAMSPLYTDFLMHRGS
ncbi:MAG TPA: aminotransferase class V-fold PLP-dependent enzyme [Candidatus Aminicenantes bacterium]|nr:aminotransferase class V-fold PLP-dependent enzyme [Candidatus Aminicenantes bacterium]HRY66319.1 aminotransferase class V-fold PLP-dependent enzyme [Candidatus Aminicenantes bacterium]HRZ73234.1 aminotransferase class V-fold PLP-dependent enzyme [Candidatus Aminicenantes bacterium]